MMISVDPAATLQVADKADLALADLEEIFATCDAATASAAALLDNGAPSVAASVRDVAAREGGNRTKAFAQAHASTASLRDAVGDFVRFGEETVEELEKMRRGAEQVFAYGVDRFQQGVEDVRDFGEGVIDGARDLGEDVVDGARDFGEGVIDGARDLGEGVVEGARNVGEDVVDGARDLAEKVSQLDPRRIFGG
jgi:hypothetical protein